MRKKDDQNLNGNNNDDTRNDIYVKLSLSAQESVSIEACPDPADLAAFCEGRLHGKTRKAMLAHLNACNTCRRHWLLVSETMAEMQPSKISWIEKIISGLKFFKLRPALAGGGLGIALTVCLLVFILLPGQNDLQQMIAHAYTLLSPADVARYNSFMTRNQTPDQDRDLPEPLFAFLSGVAAGKARLTVETVQPAQDDFNDKANAPYYELGQWSVLLQCTCISTGTAQQEFWAEWEAISSQFLKKMDNMSPSLYQSIIESLSQIQRAIQHIRQTGGKADGCEEIAMVIESLESNLGSNF